MVGVNGVQGRKYKSERRKWHGAVLYVGHLVAGYLVEFHGRCRISQ
jgi:hypothetical protein